MASANPPQSATAVQPPSLTFPRPIFAALSPHPFLQAHLSSTNTGSKSPLRANGRKAHDFRKPGINTSSLTHCNGSAVVRLGNTAVVCGVRGEILKAEDVSGTEIFPAPDAAGKDEDEDDRAEVESLRLLVPNVELSTGSTPQSLPGNAPSPSAQTLVTRLRNLLLSTRLVRARDLRILHTLPTPDEDGAAETVVKGYWTLYIDTLFISLDGNAFDAAFLAILAALRDTRLPAAYFDDDFEAILCDDDPGAATSLALRGLPVPCTFAVFEGRAGDAGTAEDGENAAWVLSDPDAFEESVCRESVCVVVDCSAGMGEQGNGTVRRIEKSGGGIVDRAAVKALVKRSVEQWAVWDKALNASP